MQKLISKYGLAAHLALLAVAPLFLFPFLPGESVATVELWLSGFTLVWLLMEPSRRNEEMLHDARMRVAGDIARDPLFWALLGAVHGLSAIPAQWRAGVLNCRPEHGRPGVRPPRPRCGRRVCTRDCARWRG